MIITPKIIEKLEHIYRKSFPDELKRYLLEKYSEEPIPYVLSEQDLYENTRHDIRDYEAGKLDISVKNIFASNN